MAGDLRTRVLDATFAEVDDNGLAGLTVEAVASRAGSSRATVYRHFPGGRDELIETTLRREVGRFFEALAADLTPAADAAKVAAGAPADVAEVVDVVAALVREAHRLLGEHRVFQRLLEDEAEAIAPPLATVYPMIHDALVAHLVTVLDPVDAVEGMDVVDPGIEGAADHAARMILSYVGTTGAWDLTDAADVEALVRHRILPGIVTDVTPDDPGH
ncbi:MAG: TetR/AcrR family transcriptional regulator [Acidimicrobiales bacterium]